MKHWRIYLLAMHDVLLRYKRREVLRWEQAQGKGGPHVWVSKGIEANDWFARLLFKTA